MHRQVERLLVAVAGCVCAHCVAFLRQVERLIVVGRGRGRLFRQVEGLLVRGGGGGGAGDLTEGGQTEVLQRAFRAGRERVERGSLVVGGVVLQRRGARVEKRVRVLKRREGGRVVCDRFRLGKLTAAVCRKGNAVDENGADFVFDFRMLFLDVAVAVVLGAEAEFAEDAAVGLAVAAVVEGAKVVAQHAIELEVDVAILAHSLVAVEQFGRGHARFFDVVLVDVVQGEAAGRVHLGVVLHRGTNFLLARFLVPLLHVPLAVRFGRERVRTNPTLERSLCARSSSITITISGECDQAHLSIMRPQMTHQRALVEARVRTQVTRL